MQQTLVLVKPDGVKKNLIGEIIARFERRGLKVSALKLVKITEESAAREIKNFFKAEEIY